MLTLTKPQRRALGLLADNADKACDPQALATTHHTLLNLWKVRLATYLHDGLWRISLGGLAYLRGHDHDLPERDIQHAIREAVRLNGPMSGVDIERAVPFAPATVRREVSSMAKRGDLPRRRDGNRYVYEPVEAA